MDKGGPREAAIRALLYVRIKENAADERGLEMMRKIRAEQGSQKPVSQFKQELRDQFLTLLLDERRAIASIPAMMKGHENEARKSLDFVRRIVTAGEPLGKEAQKRLEEVEKLFGAAKPAKEKSPK
jgi:hypothetical protein